MRIAAGWRGLQCALRILDQSPADWPPSRAAAVDTAPCAPGIDPVSTHAPIAREPSTRRVRAFFSDLLVTSD
jgi:hypothetical protein